MKTNAMTGDSSGELHQRCHIKYLHEFMTFDVNAQFSFAKYLPDVLDTHYKIPHTLNFS